MKKVTKIILCVIASIVLLGTIFGVVDYSRIKNGNKPLFMVKQYDKNGVEINYYGLGYKASGTLTYSDSYRIESVRFGLWFYTWNINNCEKCKNVDDNDNISDTELKDVYNKVGEYFGNENVNRSNLGSNSLDTKNNVVIVELIDNSKEKQESFLKNAEIDSKHSKYIKFEQGGPYTTFGTEEELNAVNNKIIAYFQSDNVEYDNLGFNYVDTTDKFVIVGLVDNSKEQQEKFKRIVVDSERIRFVQGEKGIDYR